MEPLLVKLFAAALALRQVRMTPNGIKTEFGRDRDQEEVAQLLHSGSISRTSTWTT
jgi:hypothetical protein